MQIIISDSSCLIDLHKVSLLEAFVRIPFQVSVPDVLFESELLSLSPKEKKQLLKIGLSVLELPGGAISNVQSLKRERPGLSINDCFACILAERNPGSILVTGDRGLRTASEEKGIEVHGILWGMDQIFVAETATAKQIYAALLSLQADSTVRLPAC